MNHALITDMGTKRIAIPIFKNRISPLFDVAGVFHVFEINGGYIEKQYMIYTTGQSDVRLIDRLLSENINVLICGAISRNVSCCIESNGVSLIKGIVGPFGRRRGRCSGNILKKRE